VRRLTIIALVVLVGLLVLADRGGAVIGAHVLAARVQTDEHLPQRPDASIGGIPFLTQAIGGRYSDVTITAHDLPVDGVRITTLTAHMHGVHLPLEPALRGTVKRVPVDRITATAMVSLASANAYLADHHPPDDVVRLEPGSNGSVAVVDTAQVAGQSLTLRGTGHLSVTDNVVSVHVSGLSGTDAVAGIGAQVLAEVASRLALTVPLHGIPFRLNLQSATVTSAGLTVTGAANDVVLGHPTAGS
jgi:hypothetical protein